MKRRLCLPGVGLAVIAGALLALGSRGLAAETSGCVSCHTDEAKITANLAEVAVKKSAKQSGTG